MALIKACRPLAFNIFSACDQGLAYLLTSYADTAGTQVVNQATASPR